MKLKISEDRVKHFHYGNSPESKRKEIADRFGKAFTPDDHILTCKDGKSLNIQIGKKYKCTAFDGQRVEVVDIEDMFDDGSAMLDVAHRNNRYTVSSTQIYESKLHEGDYELFSEPEYIGPYGDDGWETDDDDYYNFKQLGLITVRDVVDFYKDLSKRQIVARNGSYGVLGDIDWNVRHGYWDDRNTQAVIDALDSDPSFKFYGESLKRNKSKRLREQVEDFEDTKDIVLIKSWLEANGFDYEYIKSNQSASWFNINGQKRRIPRLDPKKNKVYSYMNNIRSLIESKSRLKEHDVEIEVKHEGILEVPDGKNVDDLPLSHFEKLAKRKGLGKITKALNNLQVWNKNDDPKLSKWAGDMIDKLNKKLKKDESIKEYYIGSEYGEYFDEYSLRQRYNTMMELDKLDDIINLYHDLGGDFDEFAIEATERGFSKIDIFTVGLCVEGIPVKEIEKRLRMLHLIDETVSRKRSTKSSGAKANSVGRFLDNMIERGKIDEKQVTVVFDKNNNIMWLGKAGFYPLYMSNIEYRSSGYDADHPHEFWINARSYTTPFEESFNRNRVTEDLDWEIIHDSDDESGNPTLWSARIDSDRYGKFIWIEKSDIGYDVVCRSGSDNWYVLDSFKYLGHAKRYVDDLLDDIDELEEAKSVEDYSHLKESSRYDYFDVPDGAFDMHNDMPTEEDEMWSELSTKQREIINALEELGYSGSLTRFFSKIIGSWTKVYDTDKSTSSGVEITVDLDGKITVQEFVYSVDEEDLTDLSPVKVVKSAADVKKLDSWAKRIKKHDISL